MNSAQQKVLMRRSYSIYVNQRNRKREAQKAKTAELSFTLEWFRDRVRDYIGKECLYCEDKIRTTNFSLDHKIPLVRLTEGLDLWCNDDIDDVFAWSNCQIICLRCNRRKGDLTDEEYLDLWKLAGGWPKHAQTYLRRKLGAPLRFYKGEGEKVAHIAKESQGALF